MVDLFGVCFRCWRFGTIFCPIFHPEAAAPIDPPAYERAERGRPSLVEQFRTRCTSVPILGESHLQMKNFQEIYDILSGEKKTIVVLKIFF